jgi:hypothetical protein
MKNNDDMVMVNDTAMVGIDHGGGSGAFDGSDGD